MPDFQRSWVWDDERIRKLLVSILQSYPIGAIMLLQSGNPNVNFKPRLIEGVDLDGAVSVGYDHLILDGQQRLTALYQSLCTGRAADLDDCIKSHITDVGYLRADNFQSFFDQRKDRLVAKIKEAMG